MFTRPLLIALSISLGAFIVYQFTLAPGVSFIDAGELATDCYTLGIAHPTGYPLFTLVGYVFAHLPFGTVIGRLNEMAAIFTALGVGALFLLSREIFLNWLPARVRKIERNVSSRKRDTKQAVTDAPLAATDSTLATIAAAAAALIAAFSETWWQQSTSIEVYPLQLFLLPLALLFFLRMLRHEESSRVGRDGYLFAVTLGLAFTNHMTTVLLAPACLYAFFARYGFSRDAFGRIGRLALPFVGALLLYVYLPLRSAQYPLMDWGHPADLTLFLKHITGGQYKIWMFTGSSSGKNWLYFWSSLPGEFAVVAMLLALVGLLKVFKASRANGLRFSVFTLLLFFGCLLYAINYDIHDIDSYFLLSYMTIAVWAGAGILWLAQNAKLSMGPVQTSIVAGSVAVLALLATNYKQVDESGNHMVDDFTRNTLTNLPPNAIIFSSAWDFWVSGSFYYQNVARLRPDVLVIDRAMLRDRPWYFEHLKKRAPDVMAHVEPETQAFLKQLRAFDRGDAYSAEAISMAYRNFTTAIVERNADRPIYVAQDAVADRDELFAPDYHAVPAGIAYRLVRSDTAFAASLPRLSWNDADYRKRDYYTDNARLLQAVPLAAYAEDRAAKHDVVGARAWIDLALRFAPDRNARLDKLPTRDREFAEQVDLQFDRMAQLRDRLRSMNP